MAGASINGTGYALQRNRDLIGRVEICAFVCITTEQRGERMAGCSLFTKAGPFSIKALFLAR